MIRILLSAKLGEHRWTQADLSRKTGIRPNTINEIYHEICDRINLEHLDLICEALNCDIPDLLVRVPNGEEMKAPTNRNKRQTSHKIKKTEISGNQDAGSFANKD